MAVGSEFVTFPPKHMVSRTTYHGDVRVTIMNFENMYLCTLSAVIHESGEPDRVMWLMALAAS